MKMNCWGGDGDGDGVCVYSLADGIGVFVSGTFLALSLQRIGIAGRWRLYVKPSIVRPMCSQRALSRSTTSEGCPLQCLASHQCSSQINSICVIHPRHYQSLYNMESTSARRPVLSPSPSPLPSSEGLRSLVEGRRQR